MSMVSIPMYIMYIDNNASIMTLECYSGSPIFLERHRSESFIAALRFSLLHIFVNLNLTEINFRSPVPAKRSRKRRVSKKKLDASSMTHAVLRTRA